jgi:putative ABC transport system permease protein
MSFGRVWRRISRWLPGGRDHFRKEIEAEIESHIAQMTDDNIAKGMQPEEARRAAQLRFGHAAAIQDRCQDERSVFRFEELWTDLRFGFRLLRRSPGFAFVAILTLALGIGANTAIFSLVHGVLLQQLPFNEPDRLMIARGFSIPDYEDFRQSTQSFDRTAMWATNLYTVRLNGQAEQIPGIVATPELFAILGQPLKGRGFAADENEQPLAVLSYELWQSRFGGRESVLGQSLNLDGGPHTIIGVMPRGFHFPNAQYKFWVTFGPSLNKVPEQKQNRSLHVFALLGHLRPGANAAQARAELQAFAERQAASYPNTNRDIRFNLQPILESTVAGVRPALLILLATVGFVLLIACANVANLLLARTASRQRELAVRTALGARRSRIVRQLLCESVMLSCIGGICGLLLAFGGLRWLRTWHALTIPRLDTVHISWVVLLFTLGISVVTGLVFGVAPAIHAVAPDPNEALKEGGRSASSTRGKRLRPILVAVEIALAMVVTVGAGLLVKSFVALTHVDPGFSSKDLITGMSVLIQLKPEERPSAVAAMMERIALVPGVESAGAGTGLPPETPQRVTRYEVTGSAPSPDAQYAYFLAVTDGYLPALRTRLLAGRNFSPQDTAESPKVVLVSERVARDRFGKRNPVGEKLKIVYDDQSADWRTIVGVVADVRYNGLDDKDAPAIYTPYPQNPQLLGGVYLMIRGRGDVGSTLAGIRQAVQSVSPGLYAVKLQPMQDVIDETVSAPKLNASLLSLFSVLALVLSATGVYGLLSYSVSQRMHEIGIRIALGAKVRDVVMLVMKYAMLVLCIGVIAGVAGGIASSRVLRNMLFEVQPTDPLTFVIVAVALVAVGLLACYVPVRRATKIDPMVALRYE